MNPNSIKAQSGFTLVELVIVIVIVGLLSAYAVMRNSSPANYALLSQAETMASDIRHVQSLATTWGKSLRIAVVAGANGTYSVSCVAAGAAPCDVSPIINHATGAAFSVALQQGAVLSGPAMLDISSLGQPSAAAIYGINAGGANVEVRVAALTGFVSIVVPP